MSIAGRVYRFTIDRLPDYAAVNLMHLRYFHTLPDLRNPRTFNEKIAWRKLYQRDPRFSVYSDKFAVKEEVATLVGRQHIIPTLWAGDNPEDIPFDELAPPFVIKVNHSSGGHLFIRSAAEIDRRRIAAMMRSQLRFRHGHEFREWAYYDIPRKILVERMIEVPGKEFPEDYKLFVYHGRVHFIELDSDRFRHHTRNLYDRDWNLLPAQHGYPATPRTFLRPASLELMIGIAEKIGQQFDFVRIDLYSLPDGVYFGEATFYPTAGVKTFVPEQWDLKFGTPWILPSTSKHDTSTAR